MTNLHPNMKVRYKADSTTVGWVISISGEGAKVFINGSPKLVPVNELEPAPGLTEMSPDEFRVALTRRRLEHPLTDQTAVIQGFQDRPLLSSIPAGQEDAGVAGPAPADCG